MASLLQPTDPDYTQLKGILNRQMTATQNAFRRRGENPRDLPSRTECINRFTMAALGSKMRHSQTGSAIQLTILGDPYPPSVTPFEDLKKTTIENLRLEINHRGEYLLLRFLCPAFRMTAVQNVVEDESGTVSMFALYLQYPDNIREAEDILKEKSVIILKEPYFKVGTNGGYLIRVDQPTDIIWLSEDDSRIPEKWRKSSANEMKPAEYWKQQGNDLVSRRDFFGAIEMYSRALRSSPTPEEEVILHNNRALANLRIEAFDAALDDVSIISDPHTRSEKGLYRGGLALYSLGKFKEAFEILQILVQKHPDSAPGKSELARTRLRLSEQDKGVYDFKVMYKATELRPPLVDCATFKRPVEVRESKGRGRGLFTTKEVKAGELLLCEKAFSYCFAAPPEESAKAASISTCLSSFLIDVPQKKISLGTHADLIRDISNKLTYNPSLQRSFEDLVHGDYDGVKGISVDRAPVVDTFLVAHTIHRNSFGCPLRSRDTIEDPELNRVANYKIVKQASQGEDQTTGIWIIASYINHSCDPTCTRSFIGDMQVVRATRDMPAEVEITFPYKTSDDFAKMADVSAWRFECDCSICIADRATSTAVKTQRRKLVRAFHLPNSTTKRTEKILKEFENTYKDPSSKVPRLEMFPMHLSLVKELAKRGETVKMVDQVLAAFESLGFLIEGARLSPRSSKIVVRTWGFPHEANTVLWMRLRHVYMLAGRNQLAEQAKEFARVTWVMLVGEDTTFVYEDV